MSARRPDLHTPEWKALRPIVLDRDGWQCAACGKPVEGDDATVDHVVPPKQGGTNDLSNLVTLCRSCNSTKQNRVLVRLSWFNRRWLSHV